MSCVSGVIHKLGFAARIAPANGAAMHDLAINRMSTGPRSAGL